MKKVFAGSCIAAALLSAMVAGSAIAEPAKSEKHAKAAVQFRQALLQLVRSNVGPLGGMAKGAVPFDAQVMATNGERLEQLSLMMADYFKTDTRTFNVGTDALPAIWEDTADFQSKIEALTTASKALQAAASSGDESAYRPAIGAVLKTCKGCHDSYKAD